MKKLLFAIAFLYTLTIQAQDNQNSQTQTIKLLKLYKQEFKAKTIEFLKLSGATGAFHDVIAQAGEIIPESKRAAYAKEAKGTLNALYGNLADVYMQEFTQEDIAQLIAFYNTDLGKKLASQLTLLTYSGMRIGQTWGIKLGIIARKYTN